MRNRKTWWYGILPGAALALLFALCIFLPSKNVRAVETTTAESKVEETGGPFAVLFQPFDFDYITEDLDLVIVTGSQVNIREDAGTKYDVLAIAQKGQVFVQFDSKRASNGSVWYEVLVEGEDDFAFGYIAESMCRTATLSAKGDVYANYLRIMGFPDSYIPYLKELHAQYPNWIFMATDTGLDWNTSVYEEANPSHYVGISLIHNDYIWPSSYKSMNNDNFDWASNRFKTVYDGPGWTLASDDLVAYYMDPRNFLKEDGIFQFLNLLYDANQTVAGVKAIVKDTFMADGKHIYGESFSYPELLYEIGRELGISPYYLAASIKQEIGASGTSKSISGKSTTISPGGVALKGYYNYYNVYAYTMMGMDANDVGLWFAEGQDKGNRDYDRPWNTREKALKGGAKFHAYNYLLKGQNTLYYKRFNVLDGTYRHQYMTNIMGAYSESKHLSLAYDSVARNQVLCFDIPVYRNMPGNAASQPSWDENARENLNPNNRLKSIEVTDSEKNPSVNVQDTAYAVAVHSSSVDIKALPIDGGAWVVGDGFLYLTEGENTVWLTVTAANGDTRRYELSIFNGQRESLVFTTDYSHEDGYWTSVVPGTTVSELRKKLDLSYGSSLELLNAEGKKKGDGELMKTGDQIRIYAPNGALYYTATCLIYGDVNGDGEINIFDLVAVRNHILRMEGKELKTLRLDAADVNKDGEVNIFDYVKIRNSIIRISDIEQ